jgi:hypothetical protein
MVPAKSESKICLALSNVISPGATNVLLDMEETKLLVSTRCTSPACRFMSLRITSSCTRVTHMRRKRENLRYLFFSRSQQLSILGLVSAQE